jgi:riboflavin synthase
MFTGIIQDTGTIATVRTQGDNVHFEIISKLVDRELRPGDSIAINGVCLTANEISVPGNRVTVTAVKETLSRSTLSRLRNGSKVNLELALRPNDRLGGHFVQGHVDAIGKCERIAKLQGSWEITISYPREYRELIVEKGSIAVDGVSLTAYSLADAQFQISVIPHTLAATTVNDLQAGDSVNLEFDILGKYVQRMLQKHDGKELSMQMLREFGY